VIYGKIKSDIGKILRKLCARTWVEIKEAITVHGVDASGAKSGASND